MAETQVWGLGAAPAQSYPLATTRGCLVHTAEWDWVQGSKSTEPFVYCRVLCAFQLDTPGSQPS